MAKTKQIKENEGIIALTLRNEELSKENRQLRQELVTKKMEISRLQGRIDEARDIFRDTMALLMS